MPASVVWSGWIWPAGRRTSRCPAVCSPTWMRTCWTGSCAPGRVRRLQWSVGCACTQSTEVGPGSSQEWCDGIVPSLGIRPISRRWSPPRSVSWPRAARSPRRHLRRRQVPDHGRQRTRGHGHHPRHRHRDAAPRRLGQPRRGHPSLR
jgi:hypothetical protein